MKLRTFTGLEKPCVCACGCSQVILARPDVQVVVDMESPKWKRDRYLPGHAGNGYGAAPYARRDSHVQRGAPVPAPAPPTPQGPVPDSPQPKVEPAPVPSPRLESGKSSLADNRPWKILQVTISVGDYTSVKAGVADFGKEGESLEQLGTRLVSELTQDIKTELDVVHSVQAGKPLNLTSQGAVEAPKTPSPASAGAPLPDFSPASALMAHYEREKACQASVNDPETREVVRRVQAELDDASVTRSMKKRKIANTWLEINGYERFEEADSGDLEGLRELLGEFETVN